MSYVEEDGTISSCLHDDCKKNLTLAIKLVEDFAQHMKNCAAEVRDEDENRSYPPLIDERCTCGLTQRWLALTAGKEGE